MAKPRFIQEMWLWWDRWIVSFHNDTATGVILSIAFEASAWTSLEGNLILALKVSGGSDYASLLSISHRFACFLHFLFDSLSRKRLVSPLLSSSKTSYNVASQIFQGWVTSNGSVLSINNPAKPPNIPDFYLKSWRVSFSKMESGFPQGGFHFPKWKVVSPKEGFIFQNGK